MLWEGQGVGGGASSFIFSATESLLKGGKGYKNGERPLYEADMDANIVQQKVSLLMINTCILYNVRFFCFS